MIRCGAMLVMLGATVVAACGGDGGDDGSDADDTDDDSSAVCGNSVCELSESPANCPADCEAGACDSLDPTSCSGDTFCLEPDCVAAFPRRYYFFLYGAEIDQFDPATGETWDVVGGAPDPYAAVYVNDELVHVTQVQQDNLDPTWVESTPEVLLEAGDSVTVYVYDDDVDDPDYVGGCTADPLTAAQVRGYDLDCTGDFGSISWSIGAAL